MSLDFPAAADALWALYDATGIRPEWILPVLYSESGFNPAIVNSLGYTGINQASAQMLSGHGLDSSSYAAMPASQQITTVVIPEYEGIEKQFGPLRSGTRIYQANFLPATLDKVTSLDGVLAHKGVYGEWGVPGYVYDSNTTFDYQHKGTIVLSDLAHAVGVAASTAAVKSAIDQTYAARPLEAPLRQDSVYGTDFGIEGAAAAHPLATAAVIAGGLGLAWAVHTGALGRFARRWRIPILRSAPL